MVIGGRIAAGVAAALVLVSCSAPSEKPEPKPTKTVNHISQDDAQAALDKAAGLLRKKKTAWFTLDFGVGDVEHEVDGKFDLAAHKSDVSVSAFGANQGVEVHVVTHPGEVIEDHMKYVGFGCFYRYRPASLDKKKRNVYRNHAAAALILHARADRQNAGSTTRRFRAQVRLSDAVFTIVPAMGWAARKRVPDDIMVPVEVQVTSEKDYPDEPGGLVETVTIAMADLMNTAQHAGFDLRSAAKRSRIARNTGEQHALARAVVEVFYSDYGAPVPAPRPETAGYEVTSIDPGRRPVC